MIGSMSERMCFPAKYLGRSCLNKGEEKSIQQLLCNCLGLPGPRLQFVSTNALKHSYYNIGNKNGPKDLLVFLFLTWF